MLCDGNGNVRRIGLNKVKAIRLRRTSKQCNPDEKDMMTEKAESSENAVCKFILPQLNFKAKFYYELSIWKLKISLNHLL